MKKIIYADHAATTSLSNAALEAMIPWLTGNYSNPSTLYSFAHEPRKAIRTAREIIASQIGANPDEIFFTSGGTEADNWAIKGSAYADEGKHATITSAFEHHAVLQSCATIERFGYPVAYMWPTLDGYITPKILDSYITDSTRLVSVMMVNNELGTLQPIKSLCEVAHAHGAVFHTDAVQALGHIHVNVSDLKVDMLSASAHKFNGPKGIGFLYIRKGVCIRPLADGGSQEHQMRAGTENVAGIVGMATALQENCLQIEANQIHVEKLANTLIERLQESGIRFHRNGGKDSLPGLVSLSFPGFDGEVLLHQLDLMGGICLSTGSACNSNIKEISHVLKAIRLDDEFAKGTIRVSLGKENTEEDAVMISDTIIKIIQRKNLT